MREEREREAMQFRRRGKERLTGLKIEMRKIECSRVVRYAHKSDWYIHTAYNTDIILLT